MDSNLVVHIFNCRCSTNQVFTKKVFFVTNIKTSFCKMAEDCRNQIAILDVLLSFQTKSKRQFRIPPRRFKPIANIIKKRKYDNIDFDKTNDPDYFVQKTVIIDGTRDKRISGTNDVFVYSHSIKKNSSNGYHDLYYYFKTKSKSIDDSLIKGENIVEYWERFSNLRLYQCTFCVNECKFNTKKDLKQHIESIHDDDYVCAVIGCAKIITSKRSLKRHHETFHSDIKLFNSSIRITKVFQEKINLENNNK